MRRRFVTGTVVLAVLAAPALRAQETQQQPSTPTLKTGITYEDRSSERCEKQNENNPYTGMDPLTCYGVIGNRVGRRVGHLGAW